MTAADAGVNATSATAAPAVAAAEIPPWSLYLLECADGTLYAGISTDVSRRLQQHNAGTGARYTRARRPVRLVYQEPCASRSAALKRELAVKALSRKAKLALIGHLPG